MHHSRPQRLNPGSSPTLLNALWQVPLVFAAAWIAVSRLPPRRPRLPAHSLDHRPLRRSPSPRHLREPDPSPSSASSTGSNPSAKAAPRRPRTSPSPWAATRRRRLPPSTHAAGRRSNPLPRRARSTSQHDSPPASTRPHPFAAEPNPSPLNGYAGQSYHRFAQLFRVNNADVAASSEIASPITLGIRRPTLLLPAHIEAALLAEDLDAALAHEFAHMRRRDFAKNLLYELISLPIAFHPVVWLTRRRMSETRELVCDAMAADAVAGRQRYARSLLRLATQFSASAHAPTPHAIGIFDAHPFKNFERRVMNLTHHSIELRGAARLVPAALSIALIAGACTSALAFRQQVAAPQTTTPPPTVNLAVPTSDLGHVIPSAKVYVPPSAPRRPQSSCDPSAHIRPARAVLQSRHRRRIRPQPRRQSPHPALR